MRTQDIQKALAVIDTLCDADLAATDPLIKKMRLEITIGDIEKLYRELGERL